MFGLLCHWHSHNSDNEIVFSETWSLREPPKTLIFLRISLQKRTPRFFLPPYARRGSSGTTKCRAVSIKPRILPSPFSILKYQTNHQPPTPRGGLEGRVLGGASKTKELSTFSRRAPKTGFSIFLHLFYPFSTLFLRFSTLFLRFFSVSSTPKTSRRTTILTFPVVWATLPLAFPQS